MKRIGLTVAALREKGGVAEWSIAAVLKTARPARVSWVRIPPPPDIGESVIYDTGKG